MGRGETYADRGDRRPDRTHSADGLEQLELLGTVSGRREGAVQCPRLRGKDLQTHGWAYINVDDGWEIKGDSPTPPSAMPDGTIITNEKFPDMKALGDSIHALGLKFGIYSSPGPLTCGGYTASYRHEATGRAVLRAVGRSTT